MKEKRNDWCPEKKERNASSRWIRFYKGNYCGSEKKTDRRMELEQVFSDYKT